VADTYTIAPSINLQYSNEPVIFVAIHMDYNVSNRQTLTPPSGFNNHEMIGGPTGDFSIVFCSRVFSNAGATGDMTGEWSADDYARKHAFAVGINSFTVSPFPSFR
jgi:hypothetical protein